MSYKDPQKQKEYQLKYRSEHKSNWKKYKDMPYLSYEARKDYYKDYYKILVKTESYKNYRSQKAKDYRLKNPIKYKARYMVYNAIKLGILVKPEICSKCYNLTKVEAHHEDHMKPLEVIWLCRNCHLLADKK